MNYPFNIYRCSVVFMKVDAIVNAANKLLLGGGGVDGAIHDAAGPNLLKECRTLNGCSTGEAKITKGYNLNAKFVIHTVGPIYSNPEKDAILLKSCYISSLNLAKEYNLHSIAFPCISTGVYGYPLKDASIIARDAITSWVNENKEYHIDISVCCFSEREYNTYIEITK